MSRIRVVFKKPNLTSRRRIPVEKSCKVVNQSVGVDQGKKEKIRVLTRLPTGLTFTVDHHRGKSRQMARFSVWRDQWIFQIESKTGPKEAPAGRCGRRPPRPRKCDTGEK